MAVWRSFFLTIFSIVLALNIAGPAAARHNSKYAAYVMEADSGDVFYSRYADDPRYPASLTKMMTLYLLFKEMEAGRLSPDSELKVSAHAAGQPPSKLGVSAGSTIDVDTAIKAIVVKSANDVAVAIAENIADSEWKFAEKMTETAHEIGMLHTTFRNASGLPNARQRTTAHDLAILARRLIQDFPQYYSYFNATAFTWNGRRYLTHNSLTRTFDGADGLKTGYTRVSGFNLVTSAVRGDNRLIGVVMGGRTVRTRDAHMRVLLSDAFAQIDQHPTMIAALVRETPTPRLKPTLVAGLAGRNEAPTIGGSDALRDKIAEAAAEFIDDGTDDDEDGAGAAKAVDALGALIASANSNDLNDFQQARLDAIAPDEGTFGEGDAEPITGAGWSVQIGAFSSKALAEKELEDAADAGDLVDSPRIVQPVDAAEGKLYRARFTSLSAADADAACNALHVHKITCFVVAEPRPLPAK